MAEAIKVEGLAEFVRAVRKLDAEVPKRLRVGFNAVAGIVIGWAKPRIPQRSGRAAGSLRAKSTRGSVRIAAGGPRAPYYPWLDFGGAVGRHKSVKRPFLSEGRFLWAGLAANRDAIEEALQGVVTDAARAVGIEVD